MAEEHLPYNIGMLRIIIGSWLNIKIPKTILTRKNQQPANENDLQMKLK
ncbi:MAG: hypothetical protein RLO80_13640 [Hyphomonas sp.]